MLSLSLTNLIMLFLNILFFLLSLYVMKRISEKRSMIEWYDLLAVASFNGICTLFLIHLLYLETDVEEKAIPSASPSPITEEISYLRFNSQQGNYEFGNAFRSYSKFPEEIAWIGLISREEQPRMVVYEDGGASRVYLYVNSQMKETIFPISLEYPLTK